MNHDLMEARRLLETGNFTCVLCKERSIRCCTTRGVRPLVDLLHEGTFNGYSAADKVIGKATAFLYVLLGVRAVYSPVISEAAYEILQNYRIEVTFDLVVPAIFNRSHTGFCPMETAVREIENPTNALAAIENTLQHLISNTEK